MNNDSFLSQRLQSEISKNYELKVLRNTTTLDFINSYIKSSGEITDELREAAFRYIMAQNGIVTQIYTNSNFSRISNETIDNIYRQIQSSALNNFASFYQSYIRKLNGFAEEFKMNSYRDLKIAYSIYRKSNDNKWNLDFGQITEKEMTNLYNILTNTKNNNGKQQEKEINNN